MKPQSKRWKKHKYIGAHNKNKIGDKRKKSKGPGTKVIVVNNNFTDALKRFNRIVYREGILKEVKNRRYFVKPSEKKKMKLKINAARRRYENALIEAEENSNERKHYKTKKIYNNQ